MLPYESVQQIINESRRKQNIELMIEMHTINHHIQESLTNWELKTLKGKKIIERLN